jgi:peptide/nickel transport system substrate-binding protein
MLRRQLLTAAGAAAAAGTLPGPALGQGTGGAARVLKFIPQADLAVLDPIITTAYVTRHHGYMIWDTLYGYDADYRPQPQMVEGHTIEDDGRRVTMRLREGLRFHDGEPVRARDCVASIRRWAARDALGQVMMANTDELSAPDDRTILFRMKRGFPLMFEALGKPATPVCFMMPERLASQDPNQPLRGDMIGSGPFRFAANERVSGARIVYTRFEGYTPRADGTPSWTAGPKRVHFDRVEWHVTPDPATASAALQNGEMDWWEQPTGDLQPVLRRNRNVVLEIPDPTGLMALARFNHLHPPFNNPAIRRALLGAVNQGGLHDRGDRHRPQPVARGRGLLPAGTPLASDVGLDAAGTPRDMEKVRATCGRGLQRGAGHDHRRLGLPLAQRARAGRQRHVPPRRDERRIRVDRLGHGGAAPREPRAGGARRLERVLHLLRRRRHVQPRRAPVAPRPWQQAWFGWPTIPRIEELRQAWFDAPDLAGQQAVARQIQQVGLPGGALPAAWPVFPGNGLSPRPDRRAEGPAAVLERAAELSSRTDDGQEGRRGPSAAPFLLAGCRNACSDPRNEAHPGDHGCNAGPCWPRVAALGGAASLPRFAIAQPAATRVLKMVPQANSRAWIPSGPRPTYPQPRLHGLRHALRHGRAFRRSRRWRKATRWRRTGVAWWSRFAAACASTTARRCAPPTVSPLSGAG